MSILEFGIWNFGSCHHSPSTVVGRVVRSINRRISSIEPPPPWPLLAPPIDSRVSLPLDTSTLPTTVDCDNDHECILQ